MRFMQITLDLQDNNSSNIDTFDSVRDAFRIWLPNPMKVTTPSESPRKLTLVADSMHRYPLTEPDG
jgi:hypothetical protein